MNEALLFRAYGFYHCRYLSDHTPCPHYAVTVWKDQDGVAHGWCSDHLRDGYVEAIRQGWTVAESALEQVA